MASEKFKIKKQLNNQKFISFISLLGLSSYVSIDNHTPWPLILFIGVYVAVQLKEKYT